ncbi:MAG: 16S rRNA (guanine(966)-N(2))-methyltransferase RsmD [bacterium]
MGELRVIGGRWKKRRLVSPPEGKLKPTTDRVRAAFFNIVQWQIAGCDFLDVFSGSGAVGVEALSRGVKSATFIESNALNARLIERNVEKIGSTEARVMKRDATLALEILETQGAQFDVIYLDPPYDAQFLLEEALVILGRGGLLKKSATVVGEVRQGVRMLDTYGALKLEKDYTYGDTRLWVYVKEPDE